MPCKVFLKIYIYILFLLEDMRPMYNGKIWVNRSACLWPGRMHSQGAFSGDKAWSMSQETRTQEHELELWPTSLTP